MMALERARGVLPPQCRLVQLLHGELGRDDVADVTPASAAGEGYNPLLH